MIDSSGRSCLKVTIILFWMGKRSIQGGKISLIESKRGKRLILGRDRSNLERMGSIQDGKRSTQKGKISIQKGKRSI